MFDWPVSGAASSAPPPGSTSRCAAANSSSSSVSGGSAGPAGVGVAAAAASMAAVAASLVPAVPPAGTSASVAGTAGSPAAASLLRPDRLWRMPLECLASVEAAGDLSLPPGCALRLVFRDGPRAAELTLVLAASFEAECWADALRLAAAVRAAGDPRALAGVLTVAAEGGAPAAGGGGGGGGAPPVAAAGPG